jgi:hypothetical protein
MCSRYKNTEIKDIIQIPARKNLVWQSNLANSDTGSKGLAALHCFIIACTCSSCISISLRDHLQDINTKGFSHEPPCRYGNRECINVTHSQYDRNLSKFWLTPPTIFFLSYRVLRCRGIATFSWFHLKRPHYCPGHLTENITRLQSYGFGVALSVTRLCRVACRFHYGRGT